MSTRETLCVVGSTKTGPSLFSLAWRILVLVRSVVARGLGGSFDVDSWTRSSPAERREADAAAGRFCQDLCRRGDAVSWWPDQAWADGESEGGRHSRICHGRIGALAGPRDATRF